MMVQGIHKFNHRDLYKGSINTVDILGEYRGSPTYTKITDTISTTTVFGLSMCIFLCMCKWGIFALVEDPIQSH